MPSFYTLPTALGEAKIANAIALGTQVNISQLAVGDGGGSLPTPDSDRTTLVNELRRAPINRIEVDDENPNWIVVEQILPPDVGGWTIRELGLFDDEDNLIAYGNYPETYKPVLSEGSGRTQTIRFVMQVSDTAAVTLKVDPSIVLATREYVDDSIESHEQSRNHPAGTTTKQGMIKLSTSSQALAGEDDKTAMPPARVFEAFQQFGLGTKELPLLKDFHDPDVPAGFYQWNQDTLNAPKSFDPGTTGGGGAVKSIRGGDAAGWWAFLSAGGATEAEFFIANTGSHSIGWGPWREVSHSGMFEAQMGGNRGFQKLPKAPGQSRAMVIQYGTATTLETGDLVGFLIPFPAECLNVTIGTRLLTGSSQQTMAAVDPGRITRTGFRPVGATVSGNSTTFNLFYIAIGR
ncbi:phage tail protein [Halomonas cupida]|uniref:phage tail protein n=1 Tax=Halomonas cupida TaxID=44933 RepID=UPI003A8DA8D1